MKRIAWVIFVLALVSGDAHAENCSKSREYLLGGLAGDLPMPPQAYEDLFKTCMATSTMGNVKDAYVLKDGGIAVIPKQDSISATAATLSQFCDRYPRSTLRFFTRKETQLPVSVSQVIRMSSQSSTSCRKIKGTL